jgi:hypothetical protein
VKNSLAELQHEHRKLLIQMEEAKIAARRNHWAGSGKIRKNSSKGKPSKPSSVDHYTKESAEKKNTSLEGMSHHINSDRSSRGSSRSSNHNLTHPSKGKKATKETLRA